MYPSIDDKNDHLSLTIAVVAYGDSHYGGGVGSIAATDLQCIGTEDYLYECTNTTENTCDHSSDVGVDCAASFGACHQAGFTTCCTSGCNVGSCYCDAACHGFGDCCEDIEGTCPLGSCMCTIMIIIFSIKFHTMSLLIISYYDSCQ